MGKWERALPGENDDHDHDVAKEPDDEDGEVGGEEQEDHAGGHDQRLLDIVTAPEQYILVMVTVAR